MVTAGAIIAAAPAIAAFASSYAVALTGSVAFASFCATAISVGAGALAIGTIAIGVNEGFSAATGYNALSSLMGQNLYQNISMAVGMGGIMYMMGGAMLPYPSTGRPNPQNINEIVTMNGTQKNPNVGDVLTKVKMSDPRMPSWLGWQKYQQSYPLNDGTNITIHYVGNKFFPSWYPFQPWFDFKFK